MHHRGNEGANARAGTDPAVRRGTDVPAADPWGPAAVRTGARSGFPGFLLRAAGVECASPRLRRETLHPLPYQAPLAGGERRELTQPWWTVPLVTLVLAPGLALAAGRHMSLVGTLAPWPDGEYSNVAADASRGVAYLGSYDDQGVAVIDTRDPAHPVLTDRSQRTSTTRVPSSPPTRPTATCRPGRPETSDSADLDLVGRHLGRGAYQDFTFTGHGFEDQRS